MSDALFSSVQQRLLALIFGWPERSFYAAEIVRRIGSGNGAVERELTRLHLSGIVSMERIGHQKHYRANPDSPIFNELQSIIRKTIGLKEPLRDALTLFASRIKAAFVYGSVAKQTDTASSDIDLMVIADELSYSDLFSALQKAEKAIQRPVNVTILTFEEWQEKLALKNAFYLRIIKSPRIFITGSEADLEDGGGRTGRPGQDQKNQGRGIRRSRI